MKILLIGNYPYLKSQSMDRFASLLFNGLTSWGHDVRLLKPPPLIGRLRPSPTGLGKWLGYLDRIGRSNVHAIKAQLKVKPCQRVVAWVDFHTFFAAEDQDAMYSAGGAALRRTTTGAGSKTFGHELDLAMKVTLDAHTAALLGFSHMWPGGFVSRTGDDDRASLFYSQIEYKF